MTDHLSPSLTPPDTTTVSKPPPKRRVVRVPAKKKAVAGAARLDLTLDDGLTSAASAIRQDEDRNNEVVDN